MGVGSGTMMMASAAANAVGIAYSLKAQKAAMQREQQRYEQERKVAQLQAIEQENSRKDALNQTLADNLAFQSASGYYDDSRSFLNISKQAINKAEKDLSNIRLHGVAIDKKYRDQMFENTLASKHNSFGGYVSIVSGLTSGYANYQWYKDEKKTTTSKWWQV